VRTRAAVATGLAAASIVAGGCILGTTKPTPNTGPHTYSSTHFIFHHGDLDLPTIAATADAIEAEYERVIADLGAGSMPTVHVTFHPDHESLQSAVRAVAGSIPSWASGLVIAADQIHMMSFGLPSWGPHSQRTTELVHEFAHAVSMRISPSVANLPRWIWETVAIYEARQFVDPRSVPYMASLQPPTMAELNAFDNTKVYDVGFVIAEFIISRAGHSALRALIVNRGDTHATLGMTLAEFEPAWFAFARSRYNF
jgi:hypothetical protein